MLDRERVRERLAAATIAVADLDQALMRYRAAGQREDEDSFLAWLEGEGLIDATAYATVVNPDEVAVTRRIPRRFESGEAPTIVLSAGASGAVLSGAAASPGPPTPEAAGQARYVILGEAGRGGMGTVHIARDTELLRKVALKALIEVATNEPASRVRFIREVQITAQLDHPHIVPVYSLEVAPGGGPAYAMKLIEGRTFADYLEEACQAHESGARPDEAHGLPSRIEHFLKVCDAMDYAHGKGVIHRDLKPANVMLGRHNEIYVMDWGICRVLSGAADEATLALARRLSEDAGETREGSVVGTPAFMSPEQAQGRTGELGPPSDQCALGLMLYTVVTLRLPFEGKTTLEVLNNAAQARLRPIAHAYERRPVAGELAAIIRRATAMAPADRYPSVRALADDLRRYLRGAAVLARPDSLWQKAGRALGRHRQLALAVILGLVVLGLASQLYLMTQRDRALARARRHEERLQALSAAVAKRADELETRLLAVQSEVESFAAAAEQALLFGEPSRDHYYLSGDYRDPRRAPPDLAPAPGYSGRISLGWATWTLPAGLTVQTADPTLKRLMALRALRSRLLNRAEGELTGRTPAAVAAANARRAVVGMMLGLENGIGSRFPGEEHVEAGFDPRAEPWYTLAKGKVGTKWGRPFLSSVNPLVELPVSMAIYDEAETPLGVASALLSVDYIARELLGRQGLPGVRELLLIDGEGVVLIEAAHDTAPDGAPPAAPRLIRFPDPVVLEAIRKGQSAVAETVHEKRRVVAAFDRIAPLDWTLLALADEADLLDPAASNPPP
jgi:eukaryotic-like serine/threonine-protein kinase